MSGELAGPMADNNETTRWIVSNQREEERREAREGGLDRRGREGEGGELHFLFRRFLFVSASHPSNTR